MKILLSNGAHIGDIILTTSILKPLRKAYPNSTIGYLIGSWAKPVVEDHTHVDYVHFLDQTCLNRGIKPKKQKKKQEQITKNIALQEIQQIDYDIAFDLYSLYPKNAGKFLFQSQIPERVAYWNCKAPFFYNRLLFWNWAGLHMVENYGVFLEKWGVDPQHTQQMTPYLDYKTLPSFPSFLPETYILIHIGAGDPKREWSEASWKELIQRLSDFKIPLLIAGHSIKEKQLAKALTKNNPIAVDISNCLSWKELFLVIKKAHFLVGLESMAAHVAGALGIPAVVIYGGHVPIYRWRPYHSCCRVVTPAKHYFHPLKEISSSSAIHTISAKIVFKAIEEHRELHKLSLKNDLSSRDKFRL